MNQQTVVYEDQGIEMVGELFSVSTFTRPTGIVLFHALEGRGNFITNYAHNLVDRGFTVFAADMYGGGKTGSTLTECYDLLNPFLQDRSLVRRRAKLAMETFAKHSGISQENMGALGFCFGGMCALEIVRSGEPLGGVVALHAKLTKSELPTEKINSRILVLQGYDDPQVPAESTLESFGDEMRAAQVEDWSVMYFGTARHSFSDPWAGSFPEEREKDIGRTYHAIAASRSFRYAVDFFKEGLSGTLNDI